MTILTTPRLRLEPITDAHCEGLFAMNSDAAVMRYITGKPETREQTRASIERVKARWITLGYGWWSFFDRETGELVGAGGIHHLGHDLANPLEIGWRLRQDRWGQGYASEAARVMASFAFDTLQGALLCAICDPGNRSSSRLMERLGMHYRGEEVWQEQTVSVYQITRDAWYASRAPAA